MHLIAYIRVLGQLRLFYVPVFECMNWRLVLQNASRNAVAVEALYYPIRLSMARRNKTMPDSHLCSGWGTHSCQ